MVHEYAHETSSLTFLTFCLFLIIKLKIINFDFYIKIYSMVSFSNNIPSAQQIAQQISGMHIGAESLQEGQARWERGEPDYLGRDSFANIQAYIDSKIKGNGKQKCHRTQSMSCVQNVSRYYASLGYLMLIRAVTVISNCKWDFLQKC